jgi:hypothetical protein
MTKNPRKVPAGGSNPPKRTEDDLDGLTPAQADKVTALAQKYRQLPETPGLNLALKGDILNVGFRHDKQNAATFLAMADMGTADLAFYSGVLNGIVSIGSHGHRVDEQASDFLLSVVRAVEPRDGLESLLAVQMGAVHLATMMMARRLNHVEKLPQQDAAERALNKLARTYATQMEALKRYRSKGEQRVIVERVTVQSGGQAIVGAVSHGGEGQA